MTVEQSELSNGMQVVTDRMESVETVSLGVWTRVGTRYEDASLNGVSHMLEHMAFKGTARRDARGIAEEIEAVGGHLNAFTSREVTAYHATVLKEDVPLAVDIVADILQHSLFEQGELEREREVVLQEIGQANDTPEDVVFDSFQLAAYPDQPLGMPVLGPPEIVSGLTRDQLIGYMQTHYSAPRMVFAAAGKLDHDEIVGLVEDHFADLPAGEGTLTDAAAYRGGDAREDRTLEQAHLVMGFDGVGYHDPDYYAAGVASTLLGGGMSSRLFQEIREKRGLVYSIYSFASSYSDGGLFGVYAGTGEQGLGELMPVLCDELARAATDIGGEELARAKAQLRAGIVMSLESSYSRSEQIAGQVGIYGAAVPIEELQSRIAAVTEEDVMRVIARILSSAPTIAAIGPIKALESYDAVSARLRQAV
ncbi:MAG: putative Zn-dependent peptidase [Alphaproteobacteria bacterium]|jgi:predicted Zn-dependent peptidase